ncbi:MAG TPA: alpha/beta fold hydrolase [Phenylobacterium sp.]|jgi:pimeloyl-ACP methyl ester carboxylesterase|uniref:alpha/beta hydrolase n=1 Tax=Phenylobacterium sp. TaxID=1871053 RepID=UPI002CB99D76|nr:alpha/beta fold hydrolase [Phenylobacterium sp.]HXA39724.1 alpha/beta fold hydrolase [Phenylobacterium sp.]
MLRKWGFFILGVVLILGGSYLANAVQTAGGVTLRDVRFAGDQGLTQAGMLYVPPGVSAAHPAPAVLVSHGYINTREMQSPFAIELARRGFVVLAMDMVGHGYSDGAVGQSKDLGGPAALRYLQSLPFVDKANIGLEGHSMGGVPIATAAAAQPDGYKAIVFEGSTPGFLGAKAPAKFHDLAVVFGQYDEFAPLMWGVPKGSEVANSKKLAKVFGEPSPILVGKIYGAIADGSARVLENPPVTHPWEHFSHAGVGGAVDWLQQSLAGAAHPLPPGDQIWLWKDIGTGLGFVGFVCLLLGTFEVLLLTPLFASLNRPAQPVAEKRGGRWWLAFVLTAAIPALTFYPLMKLGVLFFPMQLFPQSIQNQLIVWALINAAITLALSLVLRGGKPAFTNHWGKSAGIAVATIAVGYLALAAVNAIFNVDFRFWVLALHPLDGRHAVMAIPYLILWAAFFLVALRALAANLAVKGEGFMFQAGAWKLAMSLGFIVLLVAEYATLFRTGLLLTPTEPLNTIVAIQFVPLLATVGAIAAVTYRRTNSYVPGALICALLLSWYVTAGTATHWYPGFKLPTPGAARAR